MAKTKAWDVTEHLDSPEAIAAYLAAALEEGDAQLLAAAMGDVARATGMSEIARQTGLSRESLYRSLSADGNPELSTVIKVLDAFGIALTAKPKAA
jgi:probable addiction module antidote protein